MACEIIAHENFYNLILVLSSVLSISHLLLHHLSLFDSPLESFSIWDSILLSPRNVISGVDFNSIIVFLVYLKYFFILSISLVISSYGFPVNFSYNLQPPFHGELFLALPVDTNFLIFFQDAGEFFPGMCTCPLRLQSDTPFHWFNGVFYQHLCWFSLIHYFFI